MSQLGQIYHISTNPATQFAGAIAQDAQAIESWAADLAVCGTPTARCRITGIGIVSDQNLEWELWLWHKAAGAGVSVDANSFIGYWGFPAASAKQVGGAGAWYYFVFGLDIPYTDDDANVNKPDPLAPSGRFHIGLTPRGAGKSAGASGEVKLTLYVDPTHG